MTTTLTKSASTGSISQIFGPVVDVRFPAASLPAIFSALPVKDPKANIDIVLEVSQHLGNDVARCVAMASTDGCRRGMTVVNTGAAISVPVGERTKGRLFNLLGVPPEQKDLRLIDGGHIPRLQEIIREILAWLDRFAGPVTPA